MMKTHLSAPVTEVSLEQPLDSGLRRARLALEESGTAGNTILNGLYRVLVGCRARGRCVTRGPTARGTQNWGLHLPSCAMKHVLLGGGKDG